VVDIDQAVAEVSLYAAVKAAETLAEAEASIRNNRKATFRVGGRGVGNASGDSAEGRNKVVSMFNFRARLDVPDSVASSLVKGLQETPAHRRAN
jgi:hypothetical protein